jgi:hypothetical protein
LVDVYVLVLWSVLAASSAAPVQTAAHLPEWVLNVAKSTYEPGPAPRSQTTTLFMAGQSIKVISKTVDAKGKLSIVEYRVAPDGQEVAVTGAPAYDRVSMKSIDANTTQATRKKGGKVVQTATRVTSADGTTAIFTTVGTDERGRRIHDVAVFERR